ncbi:MAG: aminotransferase class V-fold PLP-dependent enzyme [Candidatus Dormibacteraeota bacterium]|nr:aminotransferase class V-fold PLP-dependent enzyme [Candidatus Dormibacteraeota bacterium]
MDPIAARNLFPLTGRCIYLDHAAASPMSERGRATLAGLVEEQTTRPPLDGADYEWADRLRTALGRLVGAEPANIALTRGTAHGLSLLAQGLDWKQGDNIVGAVGEHPVNVYPWMALADRGVELRLAQPIEGRITPESVFSLVDDRTRLVALSQVQFWNGYRVDIETIGAELDRRAVLFALDGFQSVGALQMDLSSLPVDYLAAGACAWQLGPKGIGFCYCRPELLSRLRPVIVGSGTVSNPAEYFDYRFELAETARRLEESAPSLLDVAGYLAAVELMLEIGTDVIEKRVLMLAERLARGLADNGYQVVAPWPREPQESSGIVSFRRAGIGAQEILRGLQAAGVVGRVHSDFVRLSPHFYNTQAEVDRVLDLLAPNPVAQGGPATPPG